VTELGYIPKLVLTVVIDKRTNQTAESIMASRADLLRCMEVLASFEHIHFFQHDPRTFLI
jgi:hypothetical protein